MARTHQDRRILAPYEEYRPKRYTFVLHDTFEQRELETAASMLGAGSMQRFLKLAAHELIQRSPLFKDVRRRFAAERRKLEAKRRKEAATRPVL